MRHSFLLFLFLSFFSKNLLAIWASTDSAHFHKFLTLAKDNLTINDSLALENAEKAIVVAVREGKTENRIKALITRANAILNLGNKKEFRKSMEEVNGMLSSKSEDRLKISFHSVWATCYYNEAKLDSALQQVLTTLKLSESLNDTALIIGFTIKLQRLYLELGNVEEAISYNNKALRLSVLSKDRKKMAECYYSRAFLLNNMKQNDSALNYLEKAFVIQKELNDTSALSIILSNLAYTHSEMGHADKAVELALQSYQLRKKQGNALRIAQGLIDVADFYVSSGKAKEALKYLEEGRIYIAVIKNNRLQISYYQICSEAYEKAGDPGKALSNYKRAVAIKDSLFSAESKEKIAGLQKDYEVSSREDRIQLLDNVNKVKELELEKRKGQISFFIIAAILLFVLLIIAFRAFKNKQKLNSQLAQINEKVQNQNSTLRVLNKELIESEENLMKANSTKGQLISMLSHDLYNPVTSVINYTNMVAENSSEMSTEELRSSFLKVNAAVVPLQDLLDNILQWAGNQKGDIVPQKETVNLDKVLEEIIALYQPAASFKNVKIVSSTPPAFILNTDRLMMFFILRNVINNAVKFCESGKKIEIEAREDRKDLLIYIRDEGKGFSEDILKRLNSSEAEIAAVSDHGSGIGLSVSRKFIRSLQAEIKFRNREDGKGAEVMITIPLV